MVLLVTNTQIIFNSLKAKKKIKTNANKFPLNALDMISNQSSLKKFVKLRMVCIK